MDRRREPRLPIGKPAVVKCLDGEREVFDAEIVNASGRGMRLLLDRRLPVNTPVQVVSDDWSALGEVCYSVAEGDRWAVGLALETSLTGISELANLVDALLQRAFTQAKH